MSERIDLPGDFRVATLAEVIVQLAKAERVLIDEVDVVSGRLVRLYPTT
jgi:hypothetical protein